MALGVALLLSVLGTGLVLLYLPLGLGTLQQIPIRPSSWPQLSSGPGVSKSRPTSVPTLPQDTFVGFGASEQSWNRTHRRIGETNSYDPDETLPAVEIHRGRYFAVEMVNGRVVGFAMAFHAATTMLQARSQIMLEFPPDTKVIQFKEEAQCAEMEVNSSSLARTLGNLDMEGQAYIHFMTANPDFTWSYNPSDVTAAQIDRHRKFARSINSSC